MTDDTHFGDGSQQPIVYSCDQLVFIDFEASGLGRGSWPIEIGIAEVCPDGSVRVQSNLIRPHLSWPEEMWSPVSAQIHCIPRELLDSAHSAEIIAAEYIELMTGKTLVSDAPEFDGPWLDKLAATISTTETFNILGINAVIAQFGFAGIKRAFNYLNAVEPPHRAGEDAARLAKAWLAASEGGN